ncbi:monooxygenase FAD-binding protein (plasmid) [Nostoc linckia NIES-25]|nr:monooxygenase FAD-binding protein [Nostoc linckia NIES-25]
MLIQQYELGQFPRTKAIVEQSLRGGKMGKWYHPLSVAVRNTFIKLMGATISSSFKSLHAYRA